MTATSSRHPDGWYAIPPVWLGETVWIIGGGTSLRGFDWEGIRGRRIIGCNDAYLLGSWVGVCCFGDRGWYRIHRDRLRSYANLSRA